jgi:DNA polymerase III epsilon subunit-like protein
VSKLLFIDTETGGLNCKTDALLTMAMVVWNNGTILSRDEIFIQPEGRTVDPGALKINKIDMVEHMKVAVPRAEAAEQFATWLKCAWNGSGKAWDKPILAGHNLPFDLGFLRELFPPGVFDDMISRRFLDTWTILMFMEHAGFVPAWNAKLEKACAYFKVPFEQSEKHTSLGDIVATARLYTRLIDVARL